MDEVAREKALTKTAQYEGHLATLFKIPLRSCEYTGGVHSTFGDQARYLCPRRLWPFTCTYIIHADGCTC
jgi:hypothetical protein